MVTKVDSSGVPLVIQDVKEIIGNRYMFTLFNDAEVMATYEMLVMYLYPLPLSRCDVILKYKDINLINELLGDVIWEQFKRYDSR